MAEYLLPEFFEDSLTNKTEFAGSMKRLRTYGRRPVDRMSPDQKVSRQRLTSQQWAQLDAVSKGRYVNHLGRGHSRDKPSVSERRWAFQCLGCLYGVYYYHTDQCIKDEK